MTTYKNNSRALNYFRDGNEKIINKDYTGAINSYSIAIGIIPKYTFVFFNRGLAKQKLGLYHQAIIDFEEVLQFFS